MNEPNETNTNPTIASAPFVDVSPVGETPPVLTEDDPVENIEFVSEIEPHEVPSAPLNEPVEEVDAELENALVDLAVAGRLLSNIVSAINVVINRADTTRLATVSNPKSAKLTEVSSPTPLSERDQKILNLLILNEGVVVTNTQFSRTLGGRTGDLTSAISRIRRHGYRIESTQTIRLNGEKISKRTAGYRLTTDKQVRNRESANLIRGVLTDVLGTLS